MAMIAITTKSSIKVKPAYRSSRRGCRNTYCMQRHDDTSQIFKAHARPRARTSFTPRAVERSLPR